MRKWLLRSSLVVVGLSVVVAAFLVPVHPLTTASDAQPAPTAIFDFPAMYIPGQGWQIPPAGSVWHELWPTDCTPHNQTGYQDNGDGVVSACDNIIEGGTNSCWHITNVTTTYFISCTYHPLDVPRVAESNVHPEPGSPICQEWHIIQPDYCGYMHVTDWIDCNGNGVLDVCDVIYDGTQCWHIDKVHLDVTVAFNPATKTSSSTWSRLKGLFLR